MSKVNVKDLKELKDLKDLKKVLPEFFQPKKKKPQVPTWLLVVGGVYVAVSLVGVAAAFITNPKLNGACTCHTGKKKCACDCRSGKDEETTLDTDN